MAIRVFVFFVFFVFLQTTNTKNTKNTNNTKIQKIQKYKKIQNYRCLPRLNQDRYTPSEYQKYKKYKNGDGRVCIVFGCFVFLYFLYSYKLRIQINTKTQKKYKKIQNCRAHIASSKTEMHLPNAKPSNQFRIQNYTLGVRFSPFP